MDKPSAVQNLVVIVEETTVKVDLEEKIIAVHFIFKINKQLLVESTLVENTTAHRAIS